MDIEKTVKDLRKCINEEPCEGCHLEDSGVDCLKMIRGEALDVIDELLAERDKWAERWAEEHNARLRAEEKAAEFNRIRNELCDRCGNYKDAHNGACKGCRWEDK